MKTLRIHRLCAHPTAITWVLGAIAVNCIAFSALTRGLTRWSIIEDTESILYFAMATVGFTGLGFFAGVFTILPIVNHFCVRYNAPDLTAGHEVEILSGRHIGIRTKVYEMTTGQGGNQLARVDLGSEAEVSYADIFEPCQLLQIKCV